MPLFRFFVVGCEIVNYILNAFHISRTNLCNIFTDKANGQAINCNETLHIQKKIVHRLCVYCEHFERLCVYSCVEVYYLHWNFFVFLSKYHSNFTNFQLFLNNTNPIHWICWIFSNSIVPNAIICNMLEPKTQNSLKNSSRYTNSWKQHSKTTVTFFSYSTVLFTWTTK